MELQKNIEGAEIKPLVKRDIELDGLLDAQQKYFLKNGEMNALLEPQRLTEDTERQKNEYESQKTAAIQRIDDIGFRLQALDINIKALKGEIRLKEQERSGHDGWLMQYQREFQELQQRAQGFNKQSLAEYKEELEVQIEREGHKKLEYEIESGRLMQKKQLSEKRGHYVPNEELISFG